MDEQVNVKVYGDVVLQNEFQLEMISNQVNSI